jgi:competence protein ComEA
LDYCKKIIIFEYSNMPLFALCWSQEKTRRRWKMKSQFTPKIVNAYHQQSDIAQQETLLCPIVSPSSLAEQPTQPLSIPFASSSSGDLIEDIPDEETEGRPQKPGQLRLAVILALIGLACGIYFIWHMPSTNSSAPVLAQSSPTNTNKGDVNSTVTTNAPGGTILVYVTGAIQRPGVYTLSNGARVYQLLEMAGGPLPNANLVALNLADKLVDGEEIYVSLIGETPPIVGSTTNNSNGQGQLVNINTASAEDLQQKLHLSAKSAQDIVNYRQQHGPFRSIDQLLQVVSQTIYNKIKGQITV